MNTPDNRLSNFKHMRTLLSDGLSPFPHHAIIHESGNKDDDLLLLIAESGSHNEKITYKNLKKSILDNSVLLTGNQLISGEKTFADVCTFESTIYINGIPLNVPNSQNILERRHPTMKNEEEEQQKEHHQ